MTKEEVNKEITDAVNQMGFGCKSFFIFPKDYSKTGNEVCAEKELGSSCVSLERHSVALYYSSENCVNFEWADAQNTHSDTQLCSDVISNSIGDQKCSNGGRLASFSAEHTITSILCCK